MISIAIWPHEVLSATLVRITSVITTQDYLLDYHDVVDARASLAEAERDGTIPWEHIKVQFHL
jgi:hypothetical protein